ncbi:MAG: SRPBCC family protein [Bacteroidaceae bacterium]
MSECKFESAVKLIPYSQAAVYARISDLKNLEVIRERLSDPLAQDLLKEKMPADKMADYAEKLKDMVCDTDCVSFHAAPIGNVCLRIIERTEPTCVKFTAEGAPIALNMWIQLVAVGENECKMKITVMAELNLFIKGMVSKPLKQGIEKMADVLATLPYS